MRDKESGIPARAAVSRIARESSTAVVSRRARESRKARESRRARLSPRAVESGMSDSAGFSRTELRVAFGLFFAASRAA